MGKENINFLTAWIILGNVFATFSTDPEPTAISNSTGSPTEFGKSGTSTSTSLSSLLPLQEIMRRTHTDLRLIAERCFALTENNPARRVHIFFSLSRPADLHHISCHTCSGWRKSFVCKTELFYSSCTELRSAGKRTEIIAAFLFI